MLPSHLNGDEINLSKYKNVVKALQALNYNKPVFILPQGVIKEERKKLALSPFYKSNILGEKETLSGTIKTIGINRNDYWYPLN